MRKSSRSIMFILLAVALTFALAACSGGSDSKSSSAGGKGSDAKKEVTLDYLWFTDGIEGDVMKGIIADYQKENPHVKINLIEVAYKDLQTKLKTMIAGGKPPALARMTDTGLFANQALDLTPYVGSVESFTSQFVDSIKPYYVVDNKIIAGPMDVTANGIIYNKTLFQKAGVQVPTSPDNVWTWDEFTAAVKQVMEKGGAKYGLVWDLTPHRWSTLLYQFGGSMISADGKKAAINSPEGVQALEYFVKLHNDGIIPKSVWLGSENPNNLFRSGTVAVHMAGNWMLSNYKDINNFEWGVTYMPKQKVRSSVPGGKYVMAFKGTGVEKEAAEFIKYLTSKEVNAKYNRDSLFISPRKDNAKLDYSFGKEMFEVFANELANTSELAANDWSRQEVVTKFSTDLKNNIIEAIAGKTSAKDALDKTAQLIDKAISEQGK
ncbi:ABC transporter substrate-binding protein [Paenibacillus thermoaerophilus]|uniref:ABC transporter substrate-binding protein n=1 Tax=Paenibacillus thermoaerophilus TaxID=1215385 RepID=A0ABW2V286_9BACL|nr:sugar ABC transporter substrate-binding protein [Paenibacillus thermoaerophilus]TMV06733.1 sugar ABC transporter substrate-binding protein [Paenibacillus thermoaerophilus]